MITVLVTGASGLLGGNVVKHLLAHDAKVISSIMPSEKDVYIPKPKEVVILNDSVFNGDIPFVDVVINCAFARSNDAKQLADAFDFTTKLISGLQKAQVDGIINISSQGVYKRLPVGHLSSEDSPIEPIDLYSMSKYAAEKMFVLSGIPHITNIRLASLNMKQRFLYAFVKSAKEEGVIHLNSPRVFASILDVTDAAEALALLALTPTSIWKPIYNLSIGRQYSLEEYAMAVQVVGRKLGYNVDIVIADNGNESASGTDISLLVRDTGWMPTVSNEMMIEKLFTL
jgi:nucleoside-diphosphate-sugar epimerase